MALTRTKSNQNSDLYHQRYSELSDEVRAKNKREDRLLDVKLKYYEKEKNIRLNILRKEQNQFEKLRTNLVDDYQRIQQDKQKQTWLVHLPKRTNIEMPIIQLSNPNLFQDDWTPLKVVRPHSAS